MKKYFGIVIIASLFLLGCTAPAQEPLSQEEAVRLLYDADCWWNMELDGGVVSKDGQDWLIKSNSYFCYGECRINSITRQIRIDPNPMCTGVVDEVNS